MPYPYDLDEINKRASADPAGFAKECEAIYSRKVHEAAGMVKERIQYNNVVLLAGPSGSGKTTTALKICSALEKIKIKATTVSLDKYYLPYDPATSPTQENGEIDYESPYCLDLEMLNKHFTALNRGGEVTIPHYNFKIQNRDPSKEKKLKLGKDEVVIFEGIHALNDLLTNEHPGSIKVYVSARSDIEEDGLLRFRRQWIRLMRRVVRDENFRGTGASETLGMWANVREGERKYIIPFKHKSDIMIDSSMAYEVSVMKQFALTAFKDSFDLLSEAEGLSPLLPALSEFVDIDAKHVPPESILREFIGGGMYKY